GVGGTAGSVGAGTRANRTMPASVSSQPRNRAIRKEGVEGYHGMDGAQRRKTSLEFIHRPRRFLDRSKLYARAGPNARGPACNRAGSFVFVVNAAGCDRRGEWTAGCRQR